MDGRRCLVRTACILTLAVLVEMLAPWTVVDVFVWTAYILTLAVLVEMLAPWTVVDIVACLLATGAT